MPPASKRFKINPQPSTTNVIDELESFQNEIQKIRGRSDSTESDNEEATGSVRSETETRLPDTKPSDPTSRDDPDLKKFIRELIRASERRVHQRLDRMEQKINRLVESQFTAIKEDPAVEEEHLIEYFEADGAEQEDDQEVDDRLFPIADETTFDWFFAKLAEETYRNALIDRRWPLTRNVNIKSFNIAVKDFLRMHFELPVCVKYSISGFGAHGIRKRKLESNLLTSYVYECFNLSLPGFHSFQDVSKAIVQFWGRAPDILNKENERAIKREMI